MNLCEKEKCTACGACVNACPKNCISYIVDENGFSYPQIADNLCINCGACQRVCHPLNDVNRNYPSKAYAVWSSDPKDRKSSTSGGAASVFYKTILEKDGVCFGAAFDNNLNVVIKGYSDSRTIEFKNSKYVHSDMGKTYESIRELLIQGNKVIFIGLPCQVASIKTFLKKDYDNLILVDIICHGTPPIEHLKEHIYTIEKKKNKKTEFIKFRDDNAFYFSSFGADGCFYKKHKELDTYLLSFFNALNYYESCYNCKYACNERVSDITIGDFWGLGLEIPFDHPYSGAISLVLTNTPKGETFFDSTRNKLFSEERPVEEALKGNDQLNRPSGKNKDRELFLKLNKEKGFEEACLFIYRDHMKKYKKIIFKQDVKSNIRKFAKKLLRR